MNNSLANTGSITYPTNGSSTNPQNDSSSTIGANGNNQIQSQSTATYLDSTSNSAIALPTNNTTTAQFTPNLLASKPIFTHAFNPVFLIIAGLLIVGSIVTFFYSIKDHDNY